MTTISKIGRADDGSDQLQEITNHKQLVDFLVLLRNRNEAQDAAASSSSSSAVVNPGAGGNFPPISEAGLSVASAVASQAGKAEKPASGATGDSPGESVVSASGAAQALKPDKLATKVVGDPGKLSEPSGLVSAEAFGVPTSSSSVTASSDKNINGLLIGTKWTSGALTYSFPDSILDYETPYRDPHASSFTPLTAAQKAAARKWIANGGEYYNVASSLSFTELLAGNDQNADLRLASSDVPSTAFGYYPQNTVAAGDVWFNRNSYQNPILGTYDYHTFGHELGHALGLKHGHEQGGVANVAMDANRDSMEFSIMTYRSFEGQNLSRLGFYTNAYGHYAQSLMMYDIAAIQYLYGAWFGYNSGNTTYTFSPTTGQMFINGVGQGVPAANVVFRTIWDGAGLDTYDYSNYATNQSIDLRPGQWSSFDTVSNAQRAILNNGYGGFTRMARGNVFNSLLYQGNLSSLIENAIGGSGNDYLLGNQANNVLDGRGGNDTINALTGTDTTKGGDGNDVVLDTDFVDFDSHDGQTGIDTISYEQVSFASGVTINLSTGQTVVAGGNTETIVNFENVIGSGGGETIIGSAASNVIDGRGGNDTINALGGADTSRGGDGDDLVFDDDFVNFDFHDGQAGTDTISYEKVSFASGVTINLASGANSGCWRQY